MQLLIKDEVSSWKEKGVNIVYRHRLIRTGYKAGNLKSAMSCDYVQDYEFVAIFDADFQPNPDFLKQTIPHFKVLITNTTEMKLTFSNVDKFCFKRCGDIFLKNFYRESQMWDWSRLDGPL